MPIAGNCQALQFPSSSHCHMGSNWWSLPFVRTLIIVSRNRRYRKGKKSPMAQIDGNFQTLIACCKWRPKCRVQQCSTCTLRTLLPNFVGLKTLGCPQMIQLYRSVVDVFFIVIANVLGEKKWFHNGSQWLVSPFPCAISLCIDFADWGLQSDRCFLHDSCSSSMSSRIRDILKFTSKICAPLIIACSTRKQKTFLICLNMLGQMKLGTPAANLFACQSLLTINGIVAHCDITTKWSVDVLSDWLLFTTPGCLGSRRSIGAHNLRAATCQDMGQSRPVHVEKDLVKTTNYER